MSGDNRDALVARGSMTPAGPDPMSYSSALEVDHEGDYFDFATTSLGNTPQHC